MGIAIGWLGGEAVKRARDAGWISGPFLRLSSLGLALVAFAGAELLPRRGGAHAGD